MKSTKFPEETILISQSILDFKNNLLLNIYQIGDKYGFRYLTSYNSIVGKIDPISQSDNYSWGYGLFDSPEQAHSMAQDYYLTHGVYLIKNQDCS